MRTLGLLLILLISLASLSFGQATQRATDPATTVRSSRILVDAGDYRKRYAIRIFSLRIGRGMLSG